MHTLPALWDVFYIILICKGMWMMVNAGVTAAPASKEDRQLELVVGDQHILTGAFDSQISLSRKGLVNVRWLDDERVLLTALKSGVVLIDPTPLSRQARRWLLRIRTEHQARKRQGSSSSPSSVQRSVARVSSPSLPRLQDLRRYNWFREVILHEDQHEVVVDCFHPRKDMLLHLAVELWPYQDLRCSPISYQLEVMVMREGGARLKRKPLVEVKGAYLERRDVRQHAEVRHLWHLSISPALRPMNYSLKHQELSAEFEDFSLRPTAELNQAATVHRSGSWALAFNYKVSAGGIQSSGHVHVNYTPGHRLLLAELWGTSSGVHQRQWRALQNLPILGYLLRSSVKKDQHQNLSFLISIDSVSSK